MQDAVNFGHQGALHKTALMCGVGVCVWGGGEECPTHNSFNERGRACCGCSKCGLEGWMGGAVVIYLLSTFLGLSLADCSIIER